MITRNIQVGDSKAPANWFELQRIFNRPPAQLLAFGLVWCGRCGQGMSRLEFIGHHRGIGNHCADCRDIEAVNKAARAVAAKAGKSAASLPFNPPAAAAKPTRRARVKKTVKKATGRGRRKRSF